MSGGQALRAAAAQARWKSTRLFGFFGTKKFDHLPFRTADGRYDPAPSINQKTGKPADAEKYTPAELASQPTLAQMAEAAIDVLSSGNHPFILFVEAGDVDFALHGNNLDNAIGAIYSGEDAVVSIARWVETHSNWDDSLLIVSSDHGHYLVLDDPQALAGRK
jgi:alkaline phosphatase